MDRHCDPFPGRSNLRALASIVLGVLLVAGCHLDKPAGASFASVIITGKTPDEVCKTTGAVFQEDGYMVRVLNPARMVFEKEGSRAQALAYGGVVDTHYGAVTLVRVRAELVDLGAGGQRLQCKAYMVRDAGSSFSEDESALLNFRSGPYQKLLDEVAKRLK
jgi:hypothetical protein